MRINFAPDNLADGNIGIENNNPGNIRFSPNVTWQGQVGERSGFVQFSSMAYGYRALIKNLQAYIKSGTDNIEAIAYRWAPPGDGNNNPSSYAKHISERTGIRINQQLAATDLASLIKIAGAISVSEIGTVYPDALQQGATMVYTGGEAPGATPPKKKIDVKVLVTFLSALSAILYIDEKLSKHEPS